MTKPARLTGCQRIQCARCTLFIKAGGRQPTVQLFIADEVDIPQPGIGLLQVV